MPAHFDIFRCEKEGGVLWQATAESLDSARSHVLMLQRSSPGEYVIFNIATGQKVVIGKAEPAGPTGKKSVA